MKRANEMEAAASKLNAHVPSVSTQAAQTRGEKPPRIREDHRETEFLCLPDELFREIGKHLPLGQWIALRQLCKALTEQVDRQPPFILLEPDVRTDKLFCQFLDNAAPEYAYKLANLVSKISLSEVFHSKNFGTILKEIAKANSWERVKIRTWAPLSVVARPLLDASSDAPYSVKRKLAYYSANKLTLNDRALVEEVQRSSSLQLTTLATEYVADFLPFIARNTEFSDLDLDLRNSATLTRETFKALHQMQGSVKRLSLESIGSVDSSEILLALLDKGLESLIINASHPGNGIDLLPWLTLQLKSLKLNATILDPTTLVEALGITKTLKKLEINYESKSTEKYFPLKDNFESLAPALRMNHTIEHLSLNTGLERIGSYHVSAALLHAILNHTTIKNFEWNCDNCEWPELVTPIKPKAMDSLFLFNCDVSLEKIVNLLQQLASLKCLHLEFQGASESNSEFLPLLSRMGLEKFTFHLNEADAWNYGLPIAECVFPGLTLLSLDGNDYSDESGFGAALASTATLTSLKLSKFGIRCIIDELLEGLMENESLERIELRLWIAEIPEMAIDSAEDFAALIKVILDHSSISHAVIECNCWGTGHGIFLPEGYCKLLEHLKPGLHLVLSGTTKKPVEHMPPEKIQAVTDIYKRIVESYFTDDSTSTETSSPVH